YEARGADVEASAALRRVLGGDPAHEVAHRGLMRLYAQSGQRQAALRQYGQLQAALARAVEAEPAAASAAPAAAAPTGAATSAASPPAATLPVALTSFVGRERELAEVRRLL